LILQQSLTAILWTVILVDGHILVLTFCNLLRNGYASYAWLSRPLFAS